MFSVYTDYLLERMLGDDLVMRALRSDSESYLMDTIFETFFLFDFFRSLLVRVIQNNSKIGKKNYFRNIVFKRDTHIHAQNYQKIS